MKNKSAH